MKKFYLLLLAVMCSVGMSWAENYLPGSFNNWEKNDNSKFVNNKITLSLPASTTYEFKIYDTGTSGTGDKWFGNTGTMDRGNCTGWKFETSKGNAKICTTMAGDYTFTISWTGSTPYLSVEYPNAAATWELFRAGGAWSTTNITFTGDNNVTAEPAKITLLDGNEVTIPQALKMESGTTININAPTDCKLKIVFDKDKSKNAYLTPEGGTNQKIQTSNSNDTVLITSISKGSYTITKCDVAYIHYLALYSEVSVSSAKYSTYYSENAAYQMPSGLEGYSFTTADGLNKEYSAGDIVPANTPLVIKENESIASHTNANTYVQILTIGGEAPENNSLLGTDVNTDLNQDADASDNYYYALSLNAAGETNSVGFYWMNSTGAAFTNGAHKAYLKLAKSLFTVEEQEAPATRRFLFNQQETTDTATAVENTEVEEGVKFIENGQLLIKKDGVVYNVMGQVVR